MNDCVNQKIAEDGRIGMQHDARNAVAMPRHSRAHSLTLSIPSFTPNVLPLMIPLETR